MRFNHAVICATVFFAPSSARAVTLEWMRQFGTSASEAPRTAGSMAAAPDGIYFTGTTAGSIDPQNAGGGDDVFVAKFDTGGNQVWVRQLGANSRETAAGAVRDAAGNILIGGSTDVFPLFAPGAGIPFLAKYDPAGNLLWGRQSYSANNVTETVNGIGTDGTGHVYLAGSNWGDPSRSNLWMGKYDYDGNELWHKVVDLSQDSQDFAGGVAADALGNVFTVGLEAGAPYIAKFDTDGNFVWLRNPPVAHGGFPEPKAVTADGLGNVYVSGRSINNDAYLVKYDTNGNELWSRTLGTSANDEGWAVSVDHLGSVYIAGFTLGNLSGTKAGASDAFLGKYDVNGNFLWSYQFGSNRNDFGFGIAADGLGHVYVTGSTDGDLGGPNAGMGDVFIAKFSDPLPEPSGIAMACFSLLTGWILHRRSAPRRAPPRVVR
jgi:hypothetical protein